VLVRDADPSADLGVTGFNFGSSSPAESLNHGQPALR
jgi:hypothetical protein